jgi:hypothetical protein
MKSITTIRLDALDVAICLAELKFAMDLYQFAYCGADA